MKLKIIFAFALVLLAAILSAAYLGFSSLAKSKNAIEKVGSNILMEQAEKYSEEHSGVAKVKLEEVFTDIEDNLLILQRATQLYFEKTELFDVKSIWDRNQRLRHLPSNQITHTEGDESAIFTSKLITVTEEMLNNIETSALLNLNFKNVHELNEDTVAYYFTGKEGYSRYYPSLNLTDIIPSDFDILQGVVYLPLTPKNNPQRKTLWSPLYKDKAGLGNMITVSAPVYADNKFIGVISSDVTIENLLKNYIESNVNQESFVLNTEMTPIILDEDSETNLILNEPSIDKSKIVYKLEPNFITQLKQIDNDSGFMSITVEGKLIYYTYTKLKKLGWMYIAILSENELFSNSELLHQELKNINDDLIFNSVILYIVLSLIFVLIISWIVGKFIRPILELTEVTKRIATEHIDQEIDIDAKDELKTLVDNFKTMQQSISKQHGNLQESNIQLQDTVEVTSKELVERKYLFDEFYKSSSDGLSIIIDGKFSDCNDALLSMFGIESKEDLKNMTPGKLAPECQPDGVDSSEMFQKSLRVCMKHGFINNERLVKKMNGEEFWIDATLIKITDSDNNRNIIYSIVRPITE